MMQASGDNSVSVVEPHVETYSDNNLNEKNLGSQYIYTTEGQLIPASGDHSTTNMDLNSQHYNTVHVTDAQGIHIQPVNYNYDQQYPEGTVQQVVPVSGTVFDQDQSNTYIMEQPSFEPPVSQSEISAAEPEMTIEQQPAEYEYPTNAEDQVAYLTEQPTEGNVIDSTQQTATDEAQKDDSVVDTVVASDVSTSENPDPVNEPISEDNGVQSSENADETREVPEIIETQTGDEEVQASAVEGQSLEHPDNTANIEIVHEVDTSNATLESNDDAVQETVELADRSNEFVGDQTDAENQEVASEDKELDDETTELVEETEGTEQEVGRTPRPRGRKPKSDIPLHILGHDVNKPMENVVNGKTPKPRLGVKVPYRNLTSQIVSKAEIEKEILERGRKKQEEQRERSFARGLTSRLAQKLAPKSNKKPNNSQENQIDVDNNDNEEDGRSQSTIDNNSDLLAILEGEDDGGEIPELTGLNQTNKESTPTDETNIKNLEREIALHQLQELPYLTPKTKFVKNSKPRVYSKESRSRISEDFTSTSSKATPTIKAPKSPIKTSVSKLDVEPQIKVNMNLKTYSRKRKSSEGIADIPSPSKKTNISFSTEEIDLKEATQPSKSEPVYVTKSSRVIKKKVIWDPDESPKSKPSLKGDTNAHPKIVQKAVQPKNEQKPADLPKKSAADGKLKTEKKEEKTVLKKTTEKRSSLGKQKVSPKPKKVKARSEVDRLLGDEGAIKMLYDLKNSDNAIEEKRRKTVFSVEKTFKDLAKKANQIKSDLVNTSGTETQKNLRKKETVVSPFSAPKSAIPIAVSTPVGPAAVSRQKSKDSIRSTPPPSPTFSFPNEVSYLIRRRSSSSVSSGGEDTGGSMDFDDSEDTSDSDFLEYKKKPISTSSDPLKIKKSRKKSASEKSQKRAENRIGHYNTFTFKKTNRSVTIDLHTGTSTQCYFTSELLSELTSALNKISKEKDCHVVLIRSSKDNAFSHGLNYKELVSDKESTRKSKANQLADRVRNFIKCLIDFPKVLIAGIQGECVGLAVTMLPLFDIVIASDDARFSTKYSTIGCVAEGGFLLSVPHVSSYGLAGELLYTSQKLTADEACRRGLISKLCWPEKYQDTVRATMAAVAHGSKQSLEATKRQLRSNIKHSSDKELDSMVKELVEHWTSSECQNNFEMIE